MVTRAGGPAQLSHARGAGGTTGHRRSGVRLPAAGPRGRLGRGRSE